MGHAARDPDMDGRTARVARGLGGGTDGSVQRAGLARGLASQPATTGPQSIGAPEQSVGSAIGRQHLRGQIHDQQSNAKDIQGRAEAVGNRIGLIGTLPVES